MAEKMRLQVSSLLQGIDRYNPENLRKLEEYVDMQIAENTYDLEANLAVLKLYQFNPARFHTRTAAKILLKSLMNLPETHFLLCTSLIDHKFLKEEPLIKIIHLSALLETTVFHEVWATLEMYPDILLGITNFEESIRQYVCHVVSITYQTIAFHELQTLLGNIPESQVRNWITTKGWSEQNGTISIANQEDVIKPKNIAERISFESVAGIMVSGNTPRK